MVYGSFSEEVNFATRFKIWQLFGWAVIQSAAMKQGLPHWANILIVTAVTLLLLTYFLQTSLSITQGQLGAPLDDAWIHFQFARNISQGDGFSYNPGEPMPGSTAPLWTVALAGVGLFSQEAQVYLISSLVLSAFFLLTAVWLTYGFTFWLTQNNWTALLAGLATACTGRLLWAGLAGMETTAFAAFSLAAIWVYAKGGLRPFSALLFALASQLRPEGHLLFALVVIDTLWEFHRKERKERTEFLSFWRGVITAGVIYGLINVPYALFSLAVTERPLPNTFYAKAGSQHLFSWRTLRETVALHWQDNPIAFVLLPIGLLPVWRRSRVAAVWLVGLLIMVAFIIDVVWHHGRYTLPLIPFQMIAAAVGAQWVVEHLSTNWLKVGTAVLTGVLLLGGAWKLPAWAQMLGYNSQEILEVDVALGHWLAENTPPDALVAVDDIGAIGFLSERRLLDLNGLISPEVWPAIQSEPAGRPRNEAYARLLSPLAPDYLAVFPEWHWEVATNPVIMTELTHFVAQTKTIIGEQRAFVYQVNYWPYAETAVPQTPLNIQLGEAIGLMGYDSAVSDMLSLTLYWQTVQPVAESYDVFIHVQDAAGQIVAQADGAPVAGLAPTSRWQAGDIVQDVYAILLPPDLPAGSYTVKVGMYLRETGVRLPVQAHEGDAVQLFEFQIAE